MQNTNNTPYEKQLIAIKERKEALADRLTGLLLVSSIKSVREWYEKNDLKVQAVSGSMFIYVGTDVTVQCHLHTNEIDNYGGVVKYMTINLDRSAQNETQAGIVAVILNAYEEIKDELMGLSEMIENFDNFNLPTLSPKNFEHSEKVDKVIKSLFDFGDFDPNAVFDLELEGQAFKFQMTSYDGHSQKYVVINLNNTTKGLEIDLKIPKEDISGHLYYRIKELLAI